MKTWKAWSVIGLSFAMSAAPAEAADPGNQAGHVHEAAKAQATERGAPLFDNLGSHHRKVTTTSEQAQRYFDQGLTLIYAFNHAEAIRSFREAARLDPTCVMAWWGVALAYGPNINKPMDPEDVPKAWEALTRRGNLPPARVRRIGRTSRP